MENIIGAGNVNLELDKALLDFECGELKADTDKFVVDSPTKADWAMGKVKQANDRKAQLEQYYNEKMAMLKAFVEKEMAKQDDTINFMEQLLQPYVELQIADGKKKSIKLTNGVAGFRTVQAKFDVDKEKLLEWAKKSAPDKIKVTESVDWSGIKNEISVTKDGRAVTPDGELVDGVTVINGETQAFYVK